MLDNCISMWVYLCWSEGWWWWWLCWLRWARPCECCTYVRCCGVGCLSVVSMTVWCCHCGTSQCQRLDLVTSLTLFRPSASPEVATNDIFHHIAYCVDISHISKYFRWNIVIWLANTWHKHRYFRLKKCKFIKGSSSSHGVSVLTCGGSLWPNLIDETIEMSECDVLKYFYGVIWP